VLAPAVLAAHCADVASAGAAQSAHLTLVGVDVPIACRLPVSSARAQLGEWRQLLGTQAVAADRVSPTEISLRLRDDLDQIEAIIRLAQREKACCPFFDFAIRIEAETITLRISVPQDGAALLDHFG
jgi:hypothetical protein